jgi:hypothetical protein
MTDSLDQIVRERIEAALDAQATGVGDWQEVVRRGPSVPDARECRRPRRRIPLAIIGVAGSVVLLGLGLSLRGGGSAGVATAEAACGGSGVPAGGCLRALARLAGTDGTPPPIVYERVLSYTAAMMVPAGARSRVPLARPLAEVKRAFTANEVQTVETWVARSTRRGTRRVSVGRLVFPTARDRAAWKAAGSPSWTRMSGRSFAPATFKPYSISGDRLADPLLRPAERAALLEAAARGRDAHLLGLMRDPLGREGVAISELYDPAKGPSYPWRWIYLYDPRTSQLLAEGVWPSFLSPQASGWRAAGIYRVYAVGPRASARVPDAREGS